MARATGNSVIAIYLKKRKDLGWLALESLVLTVSLGTVPRPTEDNWKRKAGVRVCEGVL
jgi:hypothetical protein